MLFIRAILPFHALKNIKILDIPESVQILDADSDMPEQIAVAIQLLKDIAIDTVFQTQTAPDT